jgi:hypothetical protein
MAEESSFASRSSDSAEYPARASAQEELLQEIMCLLPPHSVGVVLMTDFGTARVTLSSPSVEGFDHCGTSLKSQVEGQ